MNIESGPGGNDSYRPRTLEGRIEGNVETSFPEIDPDQITRAVPLGDITWPTASLTFKKVGAYRMSLQRFGLSLPIDLYSGRLQYIDSKNKRRSVDLSLTTSEDKPVLFTGVTDGFFAYDPLAKGQPNPFYVVGIQPDELKSNMNRMSGIYHELGHVDIYHTNADTQLLKASISPKEMLPSVVKAEAYTAELSAALHRVPDSTTRQSLFELMGMNYQASRIITLFHERNAWAAGINLAKGNQYPTGFKTSKGYFDYARLCLESYARYYNENRFVNGWHR